MQHSPKTKNCFANEALGKGRRAKVLSTDYQGSPLCEYVDAGQVYDGITTTAVVAQYDPVALLISKIPGTVEVYVDQTVGQAELLYGGADGVFTPVVNGNPQAKTVAARTSAGLVEAILLEDFVDLDQPGEGIADRIDLFEQFLVRPGLNAETGQSATTLTNSTGASPNTTIVEIANDVAGATAASNAAALATTNTRFDEINSNFSDLATTVNLLISAQGKNLNFQVSGTNMTSALCTFEDAGGITLTTAGATSDQAILEAHTDTTMSAWLATEWGTEDQITFETLITTDASIAAGIIFAGMKLTSDPTVATDANQVYFRYEAGVESGVWQIISSRANVDTEDESTVTVAVSTLYHLKLVVAADLTFKAYINGALVLTGAALTTAINLLPFVGVMTSENVAKAISVAFVRCSRSTTA